MAHFAAYWQVTPQPHRLSAGRVDELPSWFKVLEFRRERTWCYATVGISDGRPGGIEAYIIAPDQNLRAVEFLQVLAHYHLTGARLDLGHTVNLAWSSGMDRTWTTASSHSPIRRRTGSMPSTGTTAALPLPG